MRGDSRLTLRHPGAPHIHPSSFFQRSLPIVRSAVAFGWFLLKYGLVAGLIGGALALPQLFRRVDEVVRRQIEAKLAQHYAGLKVSVRSAELVEGKGIAVRGLKIVAPGLEKPYCDLLCVEEMYLSCRTELEELLKGEPEVEWMVLRRPTLRASRLADGTWSTAALLPLPTPSRKSPAVEIDDGTIELCTPGGTRAVREINVAIAGSGDTGEPSGNPRMRAFHGTFAGDLLRGAEIEGQIDPHQPRWTVRGSVASMAISPELREALPPEWAAPLAHLGSLRGDARLDFQARYDPGEEVPLDFSVSVHLVQGRLDDPRLPHPLSDVTATADLDREGIHLRRFSARCDQAALELSGRQSGYGECAPRMLEGEIKQLPLDDSLVDVLPDALRKQWFHYLPSGQVNADFKLGYDGRRWKPELVVRCQDASFTYHKFPFRLEHVRGTLELKDDVLTANLTGYSESQSIRLAAEIQDPLGAPCGWITAKGERLPLDKKLLDAVPEKAQAAIRSLEPRGTIDFSAKVWRDRPDEPWHRWLAAELGECAIRYKPFPYPISAIRGTLEMLDDHWTAHQLEGANDTGAITCRGYLNSPAGCTCGLGGPTFASRTSSATRCRRRCNGSGTISARRGPSIFARPRSFTSPRAATSASPSRPSRNARRPRSSRSVSPIASTGFKGCSTIATDGRPWRASARGTTTWRWPPAARAISYPTGAGGSASTTSPSTASASTASSSRPSRRC